MLLEIPIGLAMGGIGLSLCAESVARTLSTLQGHPPVPDRHHAQAKLVPGLGLAFAALLVLALLSDRAERGMQRAALRVAALFIAALMIFAALGSLWAEAQTPLWLVLALAGEAALVPYALYRMWRS